MIAGIETNSSRDGFRFKIPNALPANYEIDYYLMLGEVYLRKKDKVGMANILYELRSKKGDFAFADALLTSLWKQAQGDEAQAEKILDTYIQKEANTYFRNLAKNMRTNLFLSGEDEKKSMIRMDCSKNKPYYSLCRVFRMQYYIDIPNGKEKDMHKHYVNIIRVSSPFFEDPYLEWIPLLDRIDEDLPSKFAFLGFAKEAIYFQKMMMDLEYTSDGQIGENSLERLSFFQVLASDYSAAEESLNQYLNVTKGKKSSFTNRIYVKLGVLSYLQKDYKKSLSYYLKLDFGNWSNNVLHPILNEPLSISGAKDLISVTVWKQQGTEAAIKALQKIQDPEKLGEDDLWPKLRTAQFLAEQNPELASRITDEIIYMAQGKGWRKIEYMATILQGYTQILRREYRRSTIELTKSRGILNDENRYLGSEFIRNFGFVFAHSASGKRGPISGNIKEALLDYQNTAAYEDIFFIRNYRAIQFTTELFWEQATQFLKDENDAWSLLDSLYKWNQIRSQLSSQTKPFAIAQVRFMDNQFKYLSGFQSPRESKFFDSTYVESRITESAYLTKMDEESVHKALDSAKVPAVFVMPFRDSLFVFLYQPKEAKKNALVWKEIRNNRSDSFEVLEAVREMTTSVKDAEQIQFYGNYEGLITLKSLKKDFGEKQISSFVFLFPSMEIIKPQSIVSWNCPFSASQFPSGTVQLVDKAYFEGSRILKDKERAHLWDFVSSNKNTDLGIDRTWSCKSSEGNWDEISLFRMYRRIDYRTVPKTIFYSQTVLGKSFWEEPATHLDWLRFWLHSGTRWILYQPKWRYADYTSPNAYSEFFRSKDEGILFTQSPL
ncbi:hypothetical protein LPTSP4_14780 [Leptospira ryugenii]|uniref:Tetratricopeptide repeat protein n=2 Tax=Leptospira ryugenii TaxID=1917863 RepID=A0A2P2DZA1_9LEPT|nr:hypothetical protein LPTSP4_14780 [Leptospira ryugenii]